MGQAKKRGTPEQRRQQALARNTPSGVRCNECDTVIPTMIPMDTKGLTGINVAAYGTCPSCKKVTWAISGEPELVALFQETISEDAGPEGVKDRIQRARLGKP